MRLSVIIPALNEQTAIRAAVESARQPGVAEVLVVDGGSRDATVAEAAAAGARVISASPGRGCQLNAGARAAAGDAYLFLHADSRLPISAASMVETLLCRPEVSAGAFRFALDEKGWGLRLVERMVALRSRWLEFPYGDQAIFLRSETFWRVGGFPETPIMEDYELVRRLRRLGRIAIADAAVVTSARRWRRLGVWRTTLYNQLCIAAYWLRVSPERIARWRAAQYQEYRSASSSTAPSAAIRPRSKNTARAASLRAKSRS